MPYDSNKTRLLLPIVGAFASQPGGDFIVELANQLKEAEAEIKIAAGATAQSERDLTAAKAELGSANETIVRLRSGNAGYTEMLTALQTIAKSSRGAQKIAQAAVEVATGVKTEAKP